MPFKRSMGSRKARHFVGKRRVRRRLTIKKAKRGFKALRKMSLPKKKLMCGQGTLAADASMDIVAIPTSQFTNRWTGETPPTNVLSQSWNYFVQGTGEREFMGRFVNRTGMWMKLRIIRDSTDLNKANKQIRIMVLERKRDNTGFDPDYMPKFDGRVRAEFYRWYKVKYDRKFSFGSGFYAQEVATSRDITIRLKVPFKLDMRGSLPGAPTNIPATIGTIPHKNVGSLEIYAICPGAPTVAGDITLKMLDWDLWFTDSND